MVLSSYSASANTLFAWLTDSEAYTRDEESAKEKALYDCTQNNGYTKLIIGDSVCWMLFTPLQKYNHDYLIAGSSRPFTIAGQYVQVKEFLKHHPDATDIYMFESKETWESVLDAKNSYQNIVVPMLATGTFDDLDANTREEARHLFGSFLLNRQVARIYDHSSMNHKIVLNSILSYHEKVLGEDLSKAYESTPEQMSPVTEQYLPQMIALCQKQGVRLHFMHDPMADTAAKHAELAAEKEMFHSMGLDEAYTFYAGTAAFYPKDWFFDGVHLNAKDVAMNHQVIRDIMQQSGMMEGFVVPED